MGDKNRNIEFSKFIRKQFPKIKSVLVVADGEGELAKYLANSGFTVRVIESNPRWKGNLPSNLQYVKGWFNSDWDIEEDLVVGMHPDEATGEILFAAKQQNKPYAVVPCCSVGKYSGKKKIDYRDWINKLTSIFGCQQYSLKISGKNMVLYNR